MIYHRSPLGFAWWGTPIWSTSVQPRKPRFHTVYKQRSCSCPLKETCPAIEAVAEHLRNSGQRAPDPMRCIPVLWGPARHFAPLSAVTRVVVQAGKLLDIDTLDHLVIGRGRFVSLKERGLGFDGRVSETRTGYRLRSARVSIHDDDDLIYAYSRSQALEDGVLVDVSRMASEAGFRYPTAKMPASIARITGWFVLPPHPQSKIPQRYQEQHRSQV